MSVSTEAERKRYERMLSIGVRAGRLPKEAGDRVMQLYVKLAGGWSWEATSHALTDAELDELEAAIAAAELADCVEAKR